MSDLITSSNEQQKPQMQAKMSNYGNTSESTSKLKALLDSLEQPFDIHLRHDLSPFVHWGGCSDEPIHRWLRYREAYSPELIDRLELEGRILDPFSGCGSIMVGAAERNRTSIGIDINPLSTFSTKVKLTRLTKEEQKLVEHFCLNFSDLVENSERWPLPKLSIATKVFEPEILDVVLKSRTAIESFSHESTSVKDFLMLAWIESLEKVGSYYKEGNGIKYRNKRRKKGKYETIPDGEWQLKRFGADQRSFAKQAISEQICLMLEDCEAWVEGAWNEQRVLTGSALHLDKMLPDEEFDSIIFSPPYANRFDYFEAFKVEMWFGGFVDSYDELNKLRKESLRSHLAAELRLGETRIDELEDLIQIMDKSSSSWRMGVPDLLRGYFHDMQKVLIHCRRLAPRGKTHVVVGNSAFAGVIIPTDVLTAIIGQRCGFQHARVLESRHLTVSPQQRAKLTGLEKYMRESVVVFE